MAKDTTSTIKYKADIAELKSGMQQAKTAIAGAKSEFDKSVESLDNWRKSSEGVEAKLKQLRTTLTQQNNVLNNYRDQLARTEEQYGENSIEAEQLREKIEKQKSTISKTNSEIKKYENSLKDVKNAEALAEKEGISLDEAFKKLKSSARDAGKSAESASGGFTVMKGALASLVADGIKSAIGALKDFAMESEEAFSKVQASVGLTTEEFERYQDKLEELYSDNYGESLGDLGDKFAYIKQVTGETDPSKIAELTKNTIALEDTFGSDFKETLRGVQNLMTHFGLSAEEAFDLFAKGSQVGLDYTDELGDNVAEYSGNFAQAGYSAEEYFQLLENGSKSGAYNLDKVNDSINEIKNRIGDGTIEKNLSSFSSGTQDVFEQWQNGKADMKDIINSIVGDISKAKSEEEALTMAQIAFGTMGEDANLNVVKSLTTLGDTFNNVSGTMKEVDAIRYDNLSSAISGLGRTLQTSLLTPIVEKVSPTLTSLIENIVSGLTGESTVGELMNAGATWLKSVGSGLVEGIPDLISNGLTAIGQFVENVRSNAPKFIQAGLDMIHNMLKGLMNALPTLISKVPTIVSNIAGIINDNMPKILVTGGKIILTIITGLLNAIPTLVMNIPKIIKAIVDVIIAFQWLNLGKTIITKFKDGIVSMVSSVKDAGKNIFNSVKDALKNLPSKLFKIAKNAVSKFVSSLKNTKSVSSAVKSIFNAVVNGIKKLPSKMKSIGGDIVKGIWNGINDKVGWIKSKLSGFKNAVMNALKDFFKIKSPSRLMRDEIGAMLAEGIGVGFTGQIKDTVNTMKNSLGGTVSTLQSGISSVGFGGVPGVVGSSGGVVNNFYQTNNSPRALSRIEIYRQSKNLLSMRGV